MAALLAPSAAASTIRARNNILACSLGRISATNAARSCADNSIRYGLHGGIGKFCQSGRRGARSDTPHSWGRIEAVPKPPPESTKISLRQRLTQHARTRWPALSAVNVRYRGVFAYLDGQLPDGTTLPLCRLRYNGSASVWSFAIYLASRDKYEDNFLPSGLPTGSPEEALDCACGLYLNDPTAWLQPPTN
jgi:hypothetical protein